MTRAITLFGQRMTVRSLIGDAALMIALMLALYLLLVFGAAFQTGYIA